MKAFSVSDWITLDFLFVVIQSLNLIYAYNYRETIHSKEGELVLLIKVDISYLFLNFQIKFVNNQANFGRIFKQYSKYSISFFPHIVRLAGILCFIVTIIHLCKIGYIYSKMGINFKLLMLRYLNAMIML